MNPKIEKREFNSNKKLKTKNSKFGLKTIITLLLLLALAVFTIIQSVRLISILAGIGKNLLDDWVNGNDTSFVINEESRC